MTLLKESTSAKNYKKVYTSHADIQVCENTHFLKKNELCLKILSSMGFKNTITLIRGEKYLGNSGKFEFNFPTNISINTIPKVSLR